MNQTPSVIKLIDQAKLHAGIRFQWNESPAAALAATTGEITLLITTPVASSTFQAASLRIEGRAGVVSRVQVFTGTTRTGGSARTPTNLNQLVAVTSQTAVAAAPTGGADGTNIKEVYVGVGDFKLTEFILAPNTKYLLRLLNFTADATNNFATLAVDYYEVTKLDQLQ